MDVMEGGMTSSEVRKKGRWMEGGRGVEEEIQGAKGVA